MGRSHERLGADGSHVKKRRKHGKSARRAGDSDDDAVRFSSFDSAGLIQSAGDYANYVSDQLEFTGFDLGSVRRVVAPETIQESMPDDVSLADYEDQWEVERQRYSNYLRNIKERDKALIKSANDKMKRAREKGKSRASLTQDEVEALERRRLQEQQDSAKTKDRRSSVSKGSRSTSATNLSVEKTRHKSGSRFFSSPTANSSRTRVPRSPKTSRSASIDTASGPPEPQAGYMVPGPDGRPIYAPFPYFAPPVAYSRSSNSRAVSASSAAHEGQYVPYAPRHFTPQEHRVTSSTSARRAHMEELHMPHSRTRASSSADVAQFTSRPGGGSSSSGRRNVSGPADMSYSSRARKAVSPLHEYAAAAPPQIAEETSPERRVRAELSEDSGSNGSVVVVRQGGVSGSGDSSSDSESDGVSVRVSLSGKQGYKIERKPVGSRARERERERDRARERDKERDSGHRDKDRDKEKDKRRKKR